jgi:hypothetical protein
MPTLVPLGAALIGLGCSVAERSCRSLLRMLRPSPSLPWLLRAPLMAAAALAAYIGGLITAQISAMVPLFLVGEGRQRGVSQPLAVAATLLVLLAPIILLPPPRTSDVRADLLLLGIPLWHHAYLLVWPAWLNPGLSTAALHPDLYLSIVIATTISMAAHVRATLFDAVSPSSMRSRSSGSSSGGSSSSTSRHRSSSRPSSSSSSSAAASSRSATTAKHASYSSSRDTLPSSSSSSRARDAEHEAETLLRKDAAARARSRVAGGGGVLTAP